MKRSILFTAKLIFTLTLMVVIFKQIDLSLFFESVKNANFVYFAVMAALWPLSLFLSSYRWNLILKEYGISLPNTTTFNLYMISSFFNNFLPSGVGGDIYKLGSLGKKYKNSKAKIVSSVLIERGIGFFTMLLFILIIGVSFVYRSTDINLLKIYLLTGLLIIAIMLAYRLIQRYSRSHFLRTFTSFKNKRVFLGATLLSVALLMLSVFSTLLAFKAFDYQISYMLLLFLIPIISLSEIIPLSLNSIGIKEGVALYLFSLFSINISVVLAVFLAGRIILALLSLSGGISYLLVKK